MITIFVANKNLSNRSYLSYFGLICFVFLFVFYAQDLFALEGGEREAFVIQTAEVDDDTVSLELAPIVQEFIDKQGTLSLEEVVSKNQFHNIEVARVRNYKASDVYWYRFGIKNTHDRSLDLILKTKNRSVVAGGLYQLNAESLLVYQKSGKKIESVVVDYESFGDSYAFHERPILSRKYAIAFRIPSETEHYFYLRWQDKGQAIFEMEVVEIAKYFSEQMMTQAYLFLILGFSLGVLIYNISIFWRTRDHLYLSYCVYIVAFILFLETQSGSIAFIWPKFVDHELMGIFVWASAFFVMFSATRFTSKMLQLKEREPEKYTWFRAIQALCLIFVGVSFLVPYQAIEYSTYILSVAVVLLCVPTAFHVYRRYHDQAAKIYLYSFLPIGLCILLVVAIYALELIAFPFMDEALRIAFCLNLVVLSAALANQISNMEEKQRTYEGMLIAAKASERAKSDFFGKMSHEIRTPLNGVIGMSQLLDGTTLNEAQKKYLDILSTSSRALMHLVNNIIDFSQVDAGKMQLEEQEFDLQDMLLDVEKVFMMRIVETGIPLVFKVEDSLPRKYIGDLNRIRQILINLLTNAYKFTEEGFVEIKVSSLKRDSRWPGQNALRFEVIDTGIGIPPGQVDSIFEDFTQIYSSTERKHAGVGLGLAICRELSALLKGEIKLFSQLGSGSTFLLELPLRVVSREQEQVESAFINEKNPRLSSKSLLIIDDCAVCRELMADVSDAWGMKVGSVASLDEGLANARRSSEVEMKIDLVVIDNDCLDKQQGGNHFINALSRHPSTKGAAIIILVSKAGIGTNLAFSIHQQVFFLQRQALNSQYQEAFVAALDDNESYFQNNRPLLGGDLQEYLEEELGSNSA